MDRHIEKGRESCFLYLDKSGVIKLNSYFIEIHLFFTLALLKSFNSFSLIYLLGIQFFLTDSVNQQLNNVESAIYILIKQIIISEVIIHLISYINIHLLLFSVCYWCSLIYL